jgi:rare lipoprotein A (peptidoglycan hydrolase)
VGSRVIDLSKQAAKELGFVSSGVTKVKIEVVGKNAKKDQKLKDQKLEVKGITYLSPKEAELLW